jgi:hypothetical protein
LLPLYHRAETAQFTTFSAFAFGRLLTLIRRAKARMEDHKYEFVGGEPPPPVVDLITFVAGGACGSPLTFLFRFNPDCVSRQPSPLLYPANQKTAPPLYHRVRGAVLYKYNILLTKFIPAF